MRKNEVEMREVKLFEIHIYSYSKGSIYSESGKMQRKIHSRQA